MLLNKSAAKYAPAQINYNEKVLKTETLITPTEDEIYVENCPNTMHISLDINY